MQHLHPTLIFKLLILFLPTLYLLPLHLHHRLMLLAVFLYLLLPLPLVENSSLIKSVLTEPQLLEIMAVTRKKTLQQYFIPSIRSAVADNEKSRPSATTINNERETWQTTRTRPSATAINEEKEHNISDHMVGNKICTRHHGLGRCTRLCKQDSAHITSTKITDKEPNDGKGKPISELP